LPRNSDIACVEFMGRKPGGWEEIAVGAAGDETSVGARAADRKGRCTPVDSICRTAVYVTRSCGGVGGGDREVFPYPE
jgi:hypothetical protein